MMLRMLLVLIFILSCLGCSTPNKAAQFGVAFSGIYEKVDTQADGVYNQLNEQQQKKLAAGMTKAGDAIAVYNLAVLAWMATDQKPQDFDAVKQRMVDLIVEIINLIKRSISYERGNNKSTDWYCGRSGIADIQGLAG